jgi:hypothetical protein
VAGSSTLREVLGYVGAVKVAAATWPHLLCGSSILVTRDNQGAVSCINNLRRPVPDINEALRELFRVSSKLHCDVLARWVPREKLAVADALSREPDATDWGLSPDIHEKVCRRFGVLPSVDLFGSDTFHTTAEFVSKVYTPGCTAVDAFRLNWANMVQDRTAWVFPPNRAVSQALSLLYMHRINALVVMPILPASNEFIQLKQLQAQVSEPFVIPRAEDSLLPSVRFPAGTLNPAFLGLRVFRVTFP